MSDPGKGILGDWDATGDQVRGALQRAVNLALREHKQAGNSIVVWDREEDRTVVVPPDQIVIEDGSPEGAVTAEDGRIRR